MSNGIQEKINNMDEKKRATLQQLADADNVSLYDFLADLAGFKRKTEGATSRVIVVKNSTTGDITQNGYR